MYVWEISCRGEATEREKARLWVDRLLALPELISSAGIDVYVPAGASAQDPFNDDRGAPLGQVMVRFATEDELREAISALSGRNVLSARPDGVSATFNAFERRDYPVGGEIGTQIPSGFSYVVRYHYPTENQQEFVRAYLEYHPVQLASLPNIRNVICYVPLSLHAPLPAADYLIGNEVMFDDIGAFNQAMRSDERKRMREHRHPGPTFTGFNTHFPMNRHAANRNAAARVQTA